MCAHLESRPGGNDATGHVPRRHKSPEVRAEELDGKSAGELDLECAGGAGGPADGGLVMHRAGQAGGGNLEAALQRNL